MKFEHEWLNETLPGVAGMQDESSSAIDHVVAEIVAELRAGGKPSISHYCGRYPALANDIRELYPALIGLELARPGDDGPAELFPGNSEVAADLLGATSLGDFRIVREIGRGGMGIVYEAVQETLNRRVALKVLSPWTLKSPRQVRRFEREANAAARLHHTNIVPILGVGNEGRIHYLVMQLIPGCALDEVLTAVRALAGRDAEESLISASARSIARRLMVGQLASYSAEPLPASSGDDNTQAVPTYAGDEVPSRPAELIKPDFGNADYWLTIGSIGAQVADALAHAHRLGVIHRDIKPSNLLLEQSAWVADFGLAKTVDSVDLTMTGELVGTIRYLPPERLRGQSDEQGDIYGLGATLYELATLRPPFLDADEAVLLRKVAEVDPPRPRTIESRVPRDLETIIVKAMAKNPADRYRTAASLAADLRAFVQDRPISARRMSATEKLWRICRRQPALTAAIFTTALLLLVVAVGASIAAARLRYENQIARNAERRALEADESRRRELFRVHVSAARSGAVTGRIGQRLEGVRGIRSALQAVGWQELNAEQTLELRDAAIGCLAKADVREVARFPAGGLLLDNDVNPAFESFVRPIRNGPGFEIVSIADPQNVTLIKNDSDSISALGCTRAFSRQGKWIAESFHRPNDAGVLHLRVWESANQRLVLDLPSAEVGSNFDFHPDERHLLVASFDSLFRIYDLETGKMVRSSPERMRADRPRFSPRGDRIAFIGPMLLAEIVDAKTWEVQEVLTEAASARLLEFQDDDVLVVGSTEGSFYRWRFSDRHGRYLSGSHQGDLRRLIFSPNSEILASSGDGITHIRDLVGDQLLLEIPGSAVRFSPDSKRLAVHVEDELVVYELVTGAALRRLHHDEVEYATFSPDGSLIALTGWHGVSVVAGDRAPVDLRFDYCGPIAFEPQGNGLTTVGTFTPPCYWPITRGAVTQIGPPRSIFSTQLPDFDHGKLAPQHQRCMAAFAKTGQFVVADYRDGRVWKSDSIGKRPTEFAKLLNAARVAISPDGRYVAAAAVISTDVRVWDSNDNRVILDLPNFAAAAFSDDGKWFATRSPDEVRVYRTDSWQLVHTRSFPASRNEYYLSIVFQPKGDLLAVANSMQGVSLFNIKTFQLVARLPHANEGVFSHLAFSPDGNRLATVQRGIGIAIWDLARLQHELEDLKVPAEISKSPALSLASQPNREVAPVEFEAGPLSDDLAFRCWRRLAGHEALAKNWSDAVHAAYMALGYSHDIAPSIRAEVLTLSGRFHHEKGESVAARKDWEQAIELDASAVDAALGLARLHILGPEEARDPKRVALLAAIVFSRNNHDAAALAYLAIAQVRLGRPELAQSTLSQVASSDQHTPLASFAKVLVKHALGDTDTARALFAEASESLAQQRMSVRERKELETLQANVAAEIGLAN